MRNQHVAYYLEKLHRAKYDPITDWITYIHPKTKKEFKFRQRTEWMNSVQYGSLVTDSSSVGESSDEDIKNI